jgi:hypothetical protein
MIFKRVFLSVFTSLVMVISYGQTEEKKTTEVKDNTSGVKVSTDKLKATSSKSKATPAGTFDLSTTKKLNTNAVKKYAQPKTQNNPNFLAETLPEDRDVIGKRYWNNEDVTHKKTKSAVSLGTVRSNTKTVKIECRDYSYVDGDRIRILQNDQIVSENIGLKGNFYVYYATLEPGYNKFDFQALNQGLSGPNTAELTVYDANGNILSSREWNLTTGEVATLGVLRY